MTEEKGRLAEGERRHGFIARHWRGQLSLAGSCWVDGVLIGILCLILTGSLGTKSPSYLTSYATLFACLGTMAAAQVIVLVWQTVGIWRAAGKHVSRGGRWAWATLARVGVAIGVPIVAIMTYLHCDAFPARYLINLGAAEAQKGEYDRAIADYDRAILLDPFVYLAYAYYDRGLAYSHKSELDHAIADFDQAIRRSPHFALAHADRCAAYVAKDEADRAIEACGQAIQLDSKIAVAYFNRGTAYLHKGDNDRALADYDQAIRLDPNDPRQVRGRALALARKASSAWPAQPPSNQ